MGHRTKAAGNVLARRGSEGAEEGIEDGVDGDMQQTYQAGVIVANNLYEFQEKHVQWLLGRADRRGFNCTSPGGGKSVIALAAAHRALAGRILVVCEAGMRQQWQDYAVRWLPESSVATIDQGSRKNDSGPELLRQLCKRRANVQIVSYDLVGEVHTAGWEFIVLDECDTLVSYRSQTMKRLREIFAACPKAYKIGLTGTPMYSNPLDIWALLNLFWGDKLYGKATKTGDPPWRWRGRWGNEVNTEYGKSYRGIRPEVRADFKALMDTISIRATRADFGVAIPVDIRVWKHDDKRSDDKVTLEKLTSIAKESPHVAVYFWNQEPAREFFQQISGAPKFADKALLYLDGTTTPEDRAKLLAIHRERPEGILVGCGKALGRGIDLTFVEQYIVAQPTKTAHHIIQLDGRFRRLSRLDGPSAIGWFQYRMGRDDAFISEVSRRLDTYLTTVKAEAGDLAMQSAFREDTQKSFDSFLDRLITTFRGSDEDIAEDGEEDV